ncbi:predicted protein [Chaetomium globosum CBS 148.51]|uniref:Protein kinase domain-containing protein n=1 Tax=Chaetomium globosum (strain ATCC 6205 / CBS 148.51 / DSM 1962 / NBRC 6347 / NRRL 1970) TaxID=306901 RepID=Q2H9P3_CHAGB|nr:uncharacterized protein CHGG_03061 [Chaetomium globosum CBS 148.51]EAQ91126.1 predicted protein [Chaetomium globosum CBS 148.51]
MEHTPDTTGSLSAQSHHDRTRACPVTPRQDPGGDSHSCIIDYRREAFKVTWWGRVECPGLTKFPAVGDAEVSPVPLTPALAAAWKQSSPLNHGCYASVRASDGPGDRFPVLKVAHPDSPSVDLIEGEFNVLNSLRGRGTSGARGGPAPHRGQWAHPRVPDAPALQVGARIVLVDFGFAGRIGTVVPPSIPSWVYTGPVFAAEEDLTALDDLCLFS